MQVPIHVVAFLLVAGVIRVSLAADTDAQPRISIRATDDCGYYGIQSPECLSKGCCWQPSTPGGPPWCFYPEESETCTYKVTNISTAGPNTTLQLQLLKQILPELGRDFTDLTVAVEYQSPQRLHVKITPVGVQRWEVPENLIPRPTYTPMGEHQALYHVIQPAKNAPYHLTVTRREDNRTIFNTTGFSLVFKEQYLELTTSISKTASLYGVGETILSDGSLKLPRNDRTITLWNYDIASATADVNLYGSHPFYLQVEEDGTSHGVFLLNSNGMDVVLNEASLTYRVLGGVFDLYMFLGPSPESVIQQYHEVIGKPAMPPYWSLGFHQCRWGYQTLNDVKAVVAGYKAASIPLEVMWTDIDYMNKYMDFTFDEERFPVAEMKRFVDSLHASGQRWVPITDCGIPQAPGDPTYEDAMASDVFIKDPTGKPYLGQVWPGATHYPDFLKPNTTEWWTRQLQHMHDMVPIDGMWIDMNEASNFCEGEVCRAPTRSATSSLKYRRFLPGHANLSDWTNCNLQCEQPPSDSPWAHPPYPINNIGRNTPLGSKTLAMTATHYNGARQYDTHNLYGLSEAIATAHALKQIIKKRPFVLSRSTFAGLGAHAGHWTGDNAANWDNLRWSIPGIINSNMWGIPLVGADICGFMGNTNEELCARWISAGAFYPFARDHSDINSQPQELYRWPAVTAAAKKALALRYRLLPHLYSSFYMAHKSGGTVAKPLFFAAPDDATARDVSEQWLFGESVLISPVLEAGSSQVRAYFPAGTWYSLWDYSRITGPAHVTLDALLGEIPVHIWGGGIIPMQHAANTTAVVNASPVTLVVALPNAGGAPAHGTPHKSHLLRNPYADTDFCNEMRQQQQQHHNHQQQEKQQEEMHSSRLASQASQEPIHHQQHHHHHHTDVVDDIKDALMMSCGVLYMDDGESLEVDGDDSVMVFLSSTASATTKQGWLLADVNTPTIGAHKRHLQGSGESTAAQHSSQGASIGKQASKGSSENDPKGVAYDEPHRVNANIIEAVHILGVDMGSDEQVSIVINGQTWSADKVVYDDEKQVLRVTGMDVPVNVGFNLQWKVQTEEEEREVVV
eukprot:jgi/Chrzof1/1031/Cz01g37220.t1